MLPFLLWADGNIKLTKKDVKVINANLELFMNLDLFRNYDKYNEMLKLMEEKNEKDNNRSASPVSTSSERK